MLLLFVFPAAMVAAALSDMASMTIPNRLVAFLGLAFPFFAVAATWSPETIGIHLVTGFAVLTITFGCFAAGWMGGGDAKLIAASAIWLGPTASLASFVLWTSILGGALTLAFLVARACVSPTTGVARVDRLLRRDCGIPYGVAIAAAGCIVFPDLLATLPR